MGSRARRLLRGRSISPSSLKIQMLKLVQVLLWRFQSSLNEQLRCFRVTCSLFHQFSLLNYLRVLLRIRCKSLLNIRYRALTRANLRIYKCFWFLDILNLQIAEILRNWFKLYLSFNNLRYEEALFLFLKWSTDERYILDWNWVSPSTATCFVYDFFFEILNVIILRVALPIRQACYLRCAIWGTWDKYWILFRFKSRWHWVLVLQYHTASWGNRQLIIFLFCALIEF